MFGVQFSCLTSRSLVDSSRNFTMSLSGRVAVSVDVVVVEDLRVPSYLISDEIISRDS